MTGFGLGFRPALYKDIIETNPDLDFVEIISENFMAVGGNPRRRLEQVRALYPVAMHGVSLSIGSYDVLDMDYLWELKTLSDWLQPFVISDHICFTKNAGGRPFYDLLPISYNRKSLDHLVSRVCQVQDVLGRSILLENPSAYLSWRGSDLSEVHFLKELCQRSGCGLLLDLNNLVVNHKNLGLDPLDYFFDLGNEVRQFHIAGHRISEDIRVDTHDEPVSDEVWRLLEFAKGKWPDVPVLLERDDHIPPLKELLKEVAFARKLAPQPLPKRLICRPSAALPPWTEAKEIYKCADLELLTEGILTGHPIDSMTLREHFEDHLPASNAAGMVTYQFAYGERIYGALKDTFKCLYYIAEEDGFKAIVKHYLVHRASKHWSLNLIGDELSSCLRDFPLDFHFGVPQDLMAQIAELDQLQKESFLAQDAKLMDPSLLKILSPDELEELRVGLAPSARFTTQNWSLKDLVHEVANVSPPTIPKASLTFVAVTRKAWQPVVSELTSSQKALVDVIRSEARLEAIIGQDLDRLADFVALSDLGAIARLA